jgi:pimeloyl-ACP methyl ester carboxylesterase|nr:alpha/beta fold hydrolase [Kofleriaceae bacterium]
MPRPRPSTFGSTDARLFGWVHRPDGWTDARTRDTGVVLCHPIGDDYIRAHRALRHLAEQLAGIGFPVLRFDFHGCGDSAADERAPARVAAWRRDVGLAIDELRAQTGVANVAIVGLRFGATLAADVAAARGDVASVVLWHPFATGDKFAAETLRTHKMHQMLEPDSFAAGPRSYPDGEEALGFFLTSETLADAKALDLRQLAARPAPRVLVLDGSAMPADKPLADKLRALGADVDYRHIPGHKFLISIPHHSTVPDDVIATITGWLDTAHPRVAPTPAPATARAASSRVSTTVDNPRVIEEGVLFGPNDRLFGVHVRPRDRRSTGGHNGSADRPAILMLNAGTVTRIGPHRFYVPLARELAELGFDVLRMDLSGIGDSPATSEPENLTYPASGEADVHEAMAAMSSRTGATRFIVVGLCSGADIAFKLGIADRKIAGVVMMNPRTFLVHDLATVDANRGAHVYQDALFKRDNWKKLLRGEVDVVRAARVLAPRLRSMAVQRAHDLVDRVRPGLWRGTDVITDVPSALRSMANRGVDTYLVVTVRDPGVDYVDAHYGDAMRALGKLKNFRREDVPGTDHTFTSVYAQEQVKAAVRDHLRRYAR